MVFTQRPYGHTFDVVLASLLLYNLIQFNPPSLWRRRCRKNLPLYASANVMAETTTYFAALSDVTFGSVCDALRARFDLPDFVDDWHDSWQYGSAGTDDIWFNVTRAEDDSTIETWMERCPSGVNWQIIAKFETEPTDLVAVLATCLGSEPQRYQTNNN